MYLYLNYWPGIFKTRLSLIQHPRLEWWGGQVYRPRTPYRPLLHGHAVDHELVDFDSLFFLIPCVLDFERLYGAAIVPLTWHRIMTWTTRRPQGYSTIVWTEPCVG